MKKKMLFIAVIVVLSAAFMLFGFAQKPYKVVFYNLENFFDTINDPAVNDDEFTPEGPKAWNAERYRTKLANVERVFADIAAIDDRFPVVIGVSEVENRSVLEDLVATPRLRPADYQIVHFDSPEARGIDVAFLYRADDFRMEGCKAVTTVVPTLPNFRTRDILTMWGTIDNEPFYFMVIHWPSRLGGKEASDFKRMAVGEQMRRMTDSVLRLNPATKIVAMGDFNDDPSDPSISEGLGACSRLSELESGGLFNPFAEIHRAGYGTLAYGGNWNLFDNIIVSENLATGSCGRLTLGRAAGAEFCGNIFSPDYLLEREGKYRGTPLRTYVGNRYMGGFSDHLPVYICIERK